MQWYFELCKKLSKTTNEHSTERTDDNAVEEDGNQVSITFVERISILLWPSDLIEDYIERGLLTTWEGKRRISYKMGLHKSRWPESNKNGETSYAVHPHFSFLVILWLFAQKIHNMVRNLKKIMLFGHVRCFNTYFISVIVFRLFIIALNSTAHE